MKGQRLVMFILSVFALWALIGAAASAEPGTESDPLVSKSYVDRRITEVMRTVNNAASDGAAPQDVSSQDVSSQDVSSQDVSPQDVSSQDVSSQDVSPQDVSSQGVTASVAQTSGENHGTTFTPVLVEAGKTIYCGEGCELIMRSGSGKIVTSTDGVINATSGTDLKSGANAPLNSLLIVPRNDGRGVKTSDDSWFIVKGGYVIR